MSKNKILLLVVTIAVLTSALFFYYHVQKRQAVILQLSNSPLEPLNQNLNNPPNLLSIDQRPGQSHGQLMLSFPQAASVSENFKPLSNLNCERVAFNGDLGGCLQIVKEPTHSYLVLNIFNQSGDILNTFGAVGIPDRMRINNQGSFIAYTTFVKGHSYTSSGNFSTSTKIVDLKSFYHHDLEGFDVYKNNELIKDRTFNFWGVSFFPNGEDFLVSLGNNTERYILKGNVTSKRLDIVFEGAECPSVSPDGKQIAFKQQSTTQTGLLGMPHWNIAVWDLLSNQVRTLKEKRSVDDQIFWLDSKTIAYELKSWDKEKQLSRWDIIQYPLIGKQSPSTLLEWSRSPALYNLNTSKSI